MFFKKKKETSMNNKFVVTYSVVHCCSLVNPLEGRADT